MTFFINNVIIIFCSLIGVCMSTDNKLIGNEVLQTLSETEYFLSYENFLTCQNNFRLHFIDNWAGNIYRAQSAFQKCMKTRKNNSCAKPNFPKLVLQLTAYYSEKNSDEYLGKLYQAYKMMRPFAQSNWEMFI